MSSPPQNGVVVFNYAEWLVQYPEFASVQAPQAQYYFNRATMLCDNTPTSPICNLFQRTILLNAATAHFAALYGSLNGQAPRAVVGRIGNAAEGSVSVGAKYADVTPGAMAWFIQTKYGASFWAATTPYRSMQYVVPPRHSAAPWAGLFR